VQIQALKRSDKQLLGQNALREPDFGTPTERLLKKKGKPK
jgi:hypothetical protein